MNVHKYAKLTPRGRAEIVRRAVDESQTQAAVATAAWVCERTLRKWVARYRAGDLQAGEGRLLARRQSRQLGRRTAP